MDRSHPQNQRVCNENQRGFHETILNARIVVDVQLRVGIYLKVEDRCWKFGTSATKMGYHGDMRIKTKGCLGGKAPCENLTPIDGRPFLNS